MDQSEWNEAFDDLMEAFANFLNSFAEHRGRCSDCDERASQAREAFQRVHAMIATKH